MSWKKRPIQWPTEDTENEEDTDLIDEEEPLSKEEVDSIADALFERFEKLLVAKYGKAKSLSIIPPVTQRQLSTTETRTAGQ